jgi:hypothetical protein
MKTFAVVLVIALCVVDLGVCAENRRRQEPVTTGAAIWGSSPYLLVTLKSRLMLTNCLTK